MKKKNIKEDIIEIDKSFEILRVRPKTTIILPTAIGLCTFMKDEVYDVTALSTDNSDKDENVRISGCFHIAHAQYRDDNKISAVSVIPKSIVILYFTIICYASFCNSITKDILEHLTPVR